MSTSPTVILVCGIDGCPERVGEIESRDEPVRILLYNRFGDRTVPFTPRNTEEGLGFPPGTVMRDAATNESLAERESRRFAELDAETLRYIGDDQRVAKRYTAEPFDLPLEALGHIVCPEHGIRDLPDPDASVVRLREFLADTAPGSKRRYLMFRGSSVT